MQIDFQAHTVTVSGTIDAEGQTTSHITITASSNVPAALAMQGGSLTMAFTDVSGQIRGR